MANDNDILVLPSLGITEKGTEGFTNTDSDIETAFPERHTGPKLSLMIDAFLVVREFIREPDRQFFVGDAVKQAKLLLAKIDVFTPVERN